MSIARNPEFGVATAVAIRSKTSLPRLVAMGVIALLLHFIGDWRWAGPWYLAYVVWQGLLIWSAAGGRSEFGRLGPRLTYAVYAANFALVGLPSWHLWTACGEVGIAAGTMYLCGLLIQLVVVSLGARTMFWCCAAPLIAYLALVPPLAFGAERLTDGLAITACAGLMVGYMSILWRGHQRALKAMEESRRRAQALQREAEVANQAKREFLATMSHEIRTPLNGVLGMAQAMAADELSAAQRGRLEVIEQGGQNLLVLLNDLLDLSRIEAGRLELEAGVVDIQAVVAQARATFAILAEAKGVALEASVASEAAGLWSGDPARVRQILYNLVSNAVKFTDQGAVTVRATREDGWIVLRVSDTGLGIAADRLDTLFNKFVQADASMTRRFGGSGLGLAICRELAGLMGGEIAADSTPGEGSHFTVRLPLRPASADAERSAPTQARRSAPADDRPLRVLAAEDNPINQLVLRTLLGQVGLEVHIVPDGAAACAAWSERAGAETAWDVVLMDVQMPVMDGLNAARRIRDAERARGLARTPIVALTANAMAHHVDECLAAGMDVLVPKPIQLQQLLEAVDSVLTGPARAQISVD